MTPSPAGRPLSGLYVPSPRRRVLDDLVDRTRHHLLALPPSARDALFEDAVFRERRRLESSGESPGSELAEEIARLDALTRALLRGTEDDRLEAGLALVRAWVDEIHGRFSPRAYRFASTVFPTAIAGLLTARPERLRDWDLRAEQRIAVEGPTDFVRQLVEEATVILAPTHVSNLDSPVIGLALTLAGLPPFQYGAGLNLFSNPVLGWWMRRLGAYTVDRRKTASLYKDVLKDYSVRQLTHRHHSLFFPGGTRARSGALESHVKKGLLGTGLLAWQEMLAAQRPDADVYVVPMTLSFQLVLEANTLIDDHLADAGKQRYIITDDEFAQPRRVAAFVRRLLGLDAAVVCRFGEPLDVLGRPVPRDPAARREASARRRGYVVGGDGTVQADPQRDRVYTAMLADALVDAWPRDATLMNTHVAAWAAWSLLREHLEMTDPIRIIRSHAGRRHLARTELLARIDRAADRARALAAEGRVHVALPKRADALLDAALDAFSGYHRSRALAARGDDVVIEDPRLCLYYRNRAVAALGEG